MATNVRRGNVPGLPLINTQFVSSESNYSSSRLSRGLSSFNEKDNEGLVDISLCDFAQLIRITPFRNSRTSLNSTSSGQPSHGSVQGSQTEAESPTDNQSNQNKSKTREEPLRRALTLTKKSQFSKYDKKSTMPRENEDD